MRVVINISQIQIPPHSGIERNHNQKQLEHILLKERQIGLSVQMPILNMINLIQDFSNNESGRIN